MFVECESQISVRKGTTNFDMGDFYVFFLFLHVQIQSHMKRISLFLFALFFVFSMKSVAQNESTVIPFANSGFENWSTGNGYNVTVLFFSLPVYGSYTYPTDWNYPSYPVNETIDYNGMSVNVNTNLPLLKVEDVIDAVQEGSHALKMQSFMLSDIINSTVYGLAQGNLDSSLTTMVFPTVLSTGQVDIDQLFPLLEDFSDNLDSLPQLMTVFADRDLNVLIDGGIPLNGENPGRLTGYYKYTSAVSGDNGGILILGSKYNPATQRREVVGGGYTTELTDVSTYTPFELEYSPLSEIDTTQPYIEADSLIVMIFSSANEEPQQGSALYLDNLQLWTVGTPVIEDTTATDTTVVVIDTCSAIFNLTLTSVDTTHATLSWNYEGAPDHFEAEFGEQGFALGSGTPVVTDDNTLTLSDLTPDTYYDVYVRCVCDTSLWGEWAMVTFHTDTLEIPDIEDTTSTDTNSIHIYTAGNLRVYPNPAQGYCVVQFDHELPSVVRLYSINGVLLMEAVPDKERMELTLPAKGVFLLVCEMKEGMVVRKIVNLGR